MITLSIESQNLKLFDTASIHRQIMLSPTQDAIYTRRVFESTKSHGSESVALPMKEPLEQLTPLGAPLPGVEN